MSELRELAATMYQGRIDEVWGEAKGTDSLRQLLSYTIQLFRHVSPDLLSVPVVMGIPIVEGGEFDIGPTIPWERLELRHFSEDACFVPSPNGLGVLERGSVSDLVAVGPVYFLDEAREVVIVPDGEFDIFNPIPGLKSALAVPTFRRLDHALNRYGNDLARRARCRILRDAWDRPTDRRWLWRNKPEFHLRDSLEQFLVSFLTGYEEVVEVRPEQNVDETKPVDLTVRWGHSQEHALIEIKWLGKSLSGDEASISTTYTAARAREGADQLADYLDRNASRATGLAVGYLVVFDGRRRGISADSETLNMADGFHYELSEIEYEPEYWQTRYDFAAPVRLFIEPVCH